MTNHTVYSNPARHLACGMAGSRGTTGRRDLAAGKASTSAASEDAGNDVVRLNQRRVQEAGGASPPRRPRRHQLQLRIDGPTREFITDLMARAEAESVPELVRLALREYERVWFEYDGNIALPDDQAADDRSLYSAAEVGQSQNAVRPMPKLDRLNIVLTDGPLARLKRLAELSEADNQGEVIMFALCVLDAKLDEFDRLVSKPPNVSVLAEIREQLGAHLAFRKRSVG